VLDLFYLEEQVPPQGFHKEFKTGTDFVKSS